MEERQVVQQQSCRLLVKSDFPEGSGAWSPLKFLLGVRGLVVPFWGSISPGHPGTGILFSNPQCRRYSSGIHRSSSVPWCSGGSGGPSPWLLPSIIGSPPGRSVCRSVRGSARGTGGGIVICDGKPGLRHALWSGCSFWHLFCPGHLQYKFLLTNSSTCHPQPNTIPHSIHTASSLFVLSAWRSLGFSTS